jgi:hypothetical protein
MLSGLNKNTMDPNLRDSVPVRCLGLSLVVSHLTPETVQATVSGVVVVLRSWCLTAPVAAVPRRRMMKRKILVGSSSAHE